MESEIYNSLRRDIATDSIDLDTDTIKVMLVTSAYTPDQDAHTKRSDFTNEVTGAGYTAGGATLALNMAVTADNTDNGGASTPTPSPGPRRPSRPRGAPQGEGGTATADEPICYVNFVTDEVSSNGPFVITRNVGSSISCSRIFDNGRAVRAGAVPLFEVRIPCIN